MLKALFQELQDGSLFPSRCDVNLAAAYSHVGIIRGEKPELRKITGREPLL